MPAAGAARKPAAPKAGLAGKPKLARPSPAAKARPKTRAGKTRKKTPLKKTPLMTPSERQKIILAGVLLVTFLLAALIHGGECIPTSRGLTLHFHDLRGAILVSLELASGQWPKITWPRF